jgi:HNH endonuclease
MTKVTLTLELPCWLGRLLVRLMLLYRRMRYGYAFRRIPLTQGRFAIVDPADYQCVSRYKWRLCKTKGKNVLYAERSIRRPEGTYSRMLMHRQLIGPPKGYVIDHVNGCGLDNRRANLRLATAAQNAWNTGGRGGRSGYKGVWLAKDKGLWRASIVCCGQRKHLGYFQDKRDAAKAYDRAASQYHGPFAVLNFPKSSKAEYKTQETEYRGQKTEPAKRERAE